MQESMDGLMWVALGSAVGGVARFFVSGVVGRRIGETFPWGTIVVNVSGALVLGIIAAIADRRTAAFMPDIWALAAVGFIGSYTTVSSFSLQTLALVQNGELLAAGRNVALSLIGSMAAIALGLVAGAAMVG